MFSGGLRSGGQGAGGWYGGSTVTVVVTVEVGVEEGGAVVIDVVPGAVMVTVEVDASQVAVTVVGSSVSVVVETSHVAVDAGSVTVETSHDAVVPGMVSVNVVGMDGVWLPVTLTVTVVAEQVDEWEAEVVVLVDVADVVTVEVLDVTPMQEHADGNAPADEHAVA